MARQQINQFGQTRDLLKGFEKVAQSFKAWRPTADVLTRVEAVPTVFPQYDVATKVMGHPIARFCRVRGPSNEGKTTFNLGLMYSFLKRGHFAGFVDAERTTPVDWVQKLMGPYANHPGFSTLPAGSYEHVVESVREYCDKIAKARAEGDIPEETSGIICVDSIRKLVPKGLLKELLAASAADAKEAKPTKGMGRKSKKPKGVDGMGGRAGQYKAALNAAWCDELVPMLADTRMAMCVIARETDDPDADMWSEGIKVGGGNALLYDSSLDIRVLRSFITDEEDNKLILGERHRVEVRKTKVASKESRIPVGFFHTSNGKHSPFGFDLARDVLEMAKECGTITLNNNSYRFGDVKLGVGARQALVKLRADDGLLNDVEMQSRNAVAATWTEEFV